MKTFVAILTLALIAVNQVICYPTGDDIQQLQTQDASSGGSINDGNPIQIGVRAGGCFGMSCFGGGRKKQTGSAVQGPRPWGPAYNNRPSTGGRVIGYVDTGMYKPMKLVPRN